MMKLEINLLPRKGTREIFFKRWIERLKRGSFVLLGVYAVALLVVFGARFFINRTKRDLEDQYQNARAAVNALIEVESEHYLVKSKLQSASGLLSGRKSWYQVVSEVLAFVPNQGVVKGLILRSDGALEVDIETGQLQELAGMLKNFESVAVEQEFVTNVEVESVEKTSLGTYGFTLVISS